MTRLTLANEQVRIYDDFLPGVIVVPAMVAAMGMAQARGCGYVYAGA